MSTSRERVRERLAALGVQDGEAQPRRTAESLAREAYRSSRIEGCRVDYEDVVETVRELKARAEQP